MATNLTCGQAVIGLLEAYGVDTVFGMPGVHTLELYKGLAGSGIRHVLVRHEQGAGFMADGYARASGRPGVCVLITGPGVTNAATPMGEAWSDSVPMLVLSSDNATSDLGMGRGRLHEITSQQSVTAPLTAFSATALRAAEVPNLLARAFATFATERPRPVHIALPLDVMDEPATFDMRPRVVAGPREPALADVESAAALLRGAKRPVIIAGGGTVNAAPELRALAELLGAAVLLTNASKGVLPDAHPLCLGGTLTLAPSQQLLASADVVFAVGTELAETDSWISRLPLNGDLIRVDIDPDTLQRDYPAQVAILGDAARTLAPLAEALGEHVPTTAFANGALDAVREEFEASLTPLGRKQVCLLDALRRALPDDGIVVTDMTQIAYTGCSRFACAEPRSWYHPNGYGTLGYALPAGIGAKLGAPQRPVVVLVGDGGLLFTVQELATAVELGIPLAIVLWNNDGLGQIRKGMVDRDIPCIGVDPRNPDYQALAAAFGCRVTVPSSIADFEHAIAEATHADGPTLIEVREDAGFLASVPGRTNAGL